MNEKAPWSSMVVLTGLALFAGCAPRGEPPWWNASWHYRVKLDVEVRYWIRDNQAYDVVVALPELLKAAGIAGEIDPSSPRVVRCARGVTHVLPIDLGKIYNPVKKALEQAITFPVTEREYEAADYYLYFDTRANGRKDPPPHYDSPPNLVPDWDFSTGPDQLPAGWESSHAEFFRRGQFPEEADRASWLEFFVDESNVKYFSESTGEGTEGRGRTGGVTVFRWMDVEEYSGQEMLFQIKFLLTHGPWGQPVQVRLRQFRGAKELRHYAVDPRWLTITLAEGQVVHFSQYGRIASGADRIRLEMEFRGGVTTFPWWLPRTGPLDTTPIRESDYYTNLCIGDMVLRPAGKVNFPGKTYAEFVPGRWGGKNDMAFDLVGCRRLAFGVWPFGAQGEARHFPAHPAPTALHWPLDRAKATDDRKLRGPSQGTLEFDFMPHWDSSDGLSRTILLGPARWEPDLERDRLLKLAQRGGVCVGFKRGNGQNKLFFRYSDGDERSHVVSASVDFRKNTWYSIAATWDSAKGEVALFVEGKRVAITKDEPFDWYLADDGPMCFGGGDEAGDGQGRLDAALDNVRISDIVRYTSNYIPPRQPFSIDRHTRVLFRFDGLREGIHYGDDEYVAVSAIVEEPPFREDVILEQIQRRKVSSRNVVLTPADPKRFETFLARFPDREKLAAAKRIPESAKCERRRVEKLLPPGTDTYDVDVAGDHDPVNVSVTVEPLTGPLTNLRVINTALPDPFSLTTVGRGLREQGGSDEEVAVRVFQYFLWRNWFFDGGRMKSEKHQQVPEYVPYNVLNVGPHNDCGARNQALSVLYVRAGLSSMHPRDHYGHHGQEIFYDGAWHSYDNPWRPTLSRDNRHIASVREIYDDPHNSLRSVGGVGWHGLLGSVKLPRKARGTIPFFELPAGSRYVRLWQLVGQTDDPHRPVGTVAHGIIEIRSNLAAGKLLSWAEEATNLRIVKRGGVAYLAKENRSAPAHLLLRIRAAFPFTSASLKLGDIANVSLSVSDDGEQAWSTLQANRNTTVRVVAERIYEYLLKAEFTSPGSRLADFSLRSVFYGNPRSINADLKLGRNEMRLIYDGKRTTPVTVTHEYYEVCSGEE